MRDIGELFGAEVVDVGTHHIIFQLTSWSRRVEAFIAALGPFGVVETARSGVVAMLRSTVAGTFNTQEAMDEDDASAPSLADLPPG